MSSSPPFPYQADSGAPAGEPDTAAVGPRPLRPAVFRELPDALHATTSPSRAAPPATGRDGARRLAVQRAEP